MVEVNKILFEKKNDKQKNSIDDIKIDDVKKFFEDMNMQMTTRKLIDIIRSSPPDEKAILTWIYKSLETLRKSSEDTGCLTIKLSKKLNWMTWVLIGIGIAGIVLWIINLSRI